MDNRDIYLYFSATNRINKSVLEIIKKEIEENKSNYEISEKDKYKIKNLNSILLENVVKYKSHSQIIEEIYQIKQKLLKKQIKYVCIEEDDYPERLKNIYNPPLVLYYKGDISFLKGENNLAVIGSRRPSDYGVLCTKKLAKELSQRGVNIVSGLALGIDSIAHLACINGGAKTVAVLGSSVDNILPRENISIARSILENGGAIVSEYFIDSKVYPYNFSLRNRIISGLSKGVLVVEAAKKSGALITADYAVNQGASVMAVPGNINSRLSEGCNSLLKEGAVFIRNVDDIIEECKFNTLNNLKNCQDRKDSIEYDIKSLNFEQRKIFNLIKEEGCIKIDDICKRMNLDIKTINSNINELLVKDFITEMKNKVYGLNI